MWCLELDDGMRLCVDQGLVPGQSATLDTAFSFQFLTQIVTTFKDLEPALWEKLCSLIQILYLHLEYFLSKSCHIVIEKKELGFFWIIYQNEHLLDSLYNSLWGYKETKRVTLKFLICFVSGKPSKLVFTSPSLNHNLAHYNLTWSTDSFSPITAYKLRFKVSKVRIKKWFIKNILDFAS